MLWKKYENNYYVDGVLIIRNFSFNYVEKLLNIGFMNRS